jgi:hypothetical protein
LKPDFLIGAAIAIASRRQSGKQSGGFHCFWIASEFTLLAMTPCAGFFVLGPLSFLIVHAYVLLHFVLLAGVGDFDA